MADERDPDEYNEDPDDHTEEEPDEAPEPLPVQEQYEVDTRPVDEDEA